VTAGGDVYACPACRRPSCRACRQLPAADRAACRDCRRPGRRCVACLGRGDVWVTPDVPAHPGSLARVLQVIAEDGVAMPGARLVDGQVAYGADADRPPQWDAVAAAAASLAPERSERLATVTVLFPSLGPDAARAADETPPRGAG
jgi:hypothetical protein